MSEEAGPEVRTAAERFIARYGERAADEARRRAGELAAAGHASAAAEWEQIAEMAEALLARPEKSGIGLH